MMFQESNFGNKLVLQWAISTHTAVWYSYLVEDLNISLLICYQQYSLVFFFNICYSLQFFLTTLIYLKKYRTL